MWTTVEFNVSRKAGSIISNLRKCLSHTDSVEIYIRGKIYIGNIRYTFSITFVCHALLFNSFLPLMRFLTRRVFLVFSLFIILRDHAYALLTEDGSKFYSFLLPADLD